MKKIILTIGLFVALGVVKAQNPLPKGAVQLNTGVGLSSWGIPVYVGLDFGVGSDFTLGTEVSYRAYRESWNGTRYTSGITGISGNVNYHFNNLLGIPDNWDFYGGVNVGFYAWNFPEHYPGAHTSGLGLGAQLGGRYYFSKTVGLNLEFGGGNAFAGGKLGLSFRF